MRGGKNRFVNMAALSVSVCASAIIRSSMSFSNRAGMRVRDPSDNEFLAYFPVSICRSHLLLLSTSSSGLIWPCGALRCKCSWPHLQRVYCLPSPL